MDNKDNFIKIAEYIKEKYNFSTYFIDFAI